MDEKHPKLFREPTDIGDLPAFLAQLVIEDEADDREHRMEKFIIMLRSAASPKAGEILRDLVHQDVLGPLSELIAGAEAALRANILLAILMGGGVRPSVMHVDAINGR